MSFRPGFLPVRSLVAVLAVASTLGCGGGSSNGGTGAADGGGGGLTGAGSGTAIPVILPDGSTAPTVACGDENVSTASGSWDVVASGGASGTAAANLTIDASSFVVQSSGKTLAFRTNGTTMTLQWTDTHANRQSAIAVTQAGTALDTGLLPLAVGGKWTFDGQGTESCSAALSATAFNATCSQVGTPQFGELKGTVVGIRQQKLASLFGELGGVWHFTSKGTASVDATISGNVFTAVVNGDGGPVGGSGWVTVKICNGAAAGKTSSGVELAATLH
jgi:hypothetical protein